MKKFGMIILIVVSIVAIFTVTVGARKPTKLKYNKVYNINIAGSKKKEKIEVVRKKITDVNGYYFKYQVKVNNKILKYYKSDYGYYFCEVYIADLNTKDKYKEIIVQQAPNDVSDPRPRVYRYKNKKLVVSTATFRIPEKAMDGYEYGYGQVIFKKTKYIVGHIKSMKLKKNGQFKMKVLLGQKGNALKYKWITLKMSKNGKITRVNEPKPIIKSKQDAINWVCKKTGSSSQGMTCSNADASGKYGWEKGIKCWIVEFEVDHPLRINWWIVNEYGDMKQ